MKKSPNFTARITSPDFRFERGDWLKCSRLKIAVDVAGRGRVGRVSGIVLECAPMANGKLEIRIWIGEKYFRKQFTVIEGLIDWSAVDGRSVSGEDKQRDKAKRKEARSLLKKKTRKRVLRVKYAGEAGEREEQRREGALLSQEASDNEVGRASVSGSGDRQERKADESGSMAEDEGPRGDLDTSGDL